MNEETKEIEDLFMKQIMRMSVADKERFDYRYYSQFFGMF